MAALCLLLATAPQSWGQRIGEAIDASKDFQDPAAVHFVPERVVKFDADRGIGKLSWSRYRKAANLSFNKVDIAYERAESNEFPSTEYDRDPELDFSVSLVSPRTIRLRFATPSNSAKSESSLMLSGPVAHDDTWQTTDGPKTIRYRSEFGELRIHKDPWAVEFYDATGKLLTKSRTLNNTATSFTASTPFSFVRRARDLGHSSAASFQLHHDERIFGCGESFTRLNKRGQKILLYLRDAMGAQGQGMYKPIPFFLSDRGYGVFVHTSTPTAFDFGQEYDEANVLYSGDDEIDLFVFLGEPKEILTEYTAITGRSPTPPLWSFGLWMSRITYKSEQEVREVAAKLRESRIPCDVIHLDTGWFETDWQCNYKFAPSRFENPERMIEDLKQDGFRVSLWQLPYFTSKNELYPEIAFQGMAVSNAGGGVASADAVLDFSNDETIGWYQEKIADLLKLGVGAIKVDFGEDAPLDGIYASGRSGWYEHNLYPLRYNQTVAEVTREVTGEDIIWARSAWAGSQRYPLHWGGDAENTDAAMAATLRAGLSFGMSGFSFWSHDAGGFVSRPPLDLYRRWLAFSALTSHTRCHGAPPREPWEFGDEFVEEFRKTIELKYALLPYLYAEAKECSGLGHPMLRSLFFEFPADATAWAIEDQYMLGSELLVAPLFSESRQRQLYLPEGQWIDYQTGQTYQGKQWQTVTAGEIPIVLMVRSGAVLAHANIAQSTNDIDWNTIELRQFGVPREKGITISTPDGVVLNVRITRQGSVAQNDASPAIASAAMESAAGVLPRNKPIRWIVTQASNQATGPGSPVVPQTATAAHPSASSDSPAQ